MRYLILSDIHANIEGLHAILDVARGGYDQVLCCGDIVGYGADPNAACAWVRQNCGAVIRGNHDKVCAGIEGLEDFNPMAQQAVVWTRNALTEENGAWLRQLPKGPLDFDGFALAHGSPRDEDEYLIESYEVIHARQFMSRPLVFFGHTHVQGGFAFRGPKLFEIEPVSTNFPSSVLELQPGNEHLVNPGSVGQPRDHDPRASAALYDAAARTIELFRAPYDIAGAQEKIRKAGLPGVLADRLERGY